MKEIQDFLSYISGLCAQHKSIKHSDEECHFASSLEDGQMLFARQMHYPCVVVDAGDIHFSEEQTQLFINSDIVIYFVDHVADAGNMIEINGAFVKNLDICTDFIKRMYLDKKDTENNRFLRYFEVGDAAVEKVFLEANGLFGWAMGINFKNRFYMAKCEEQEEESVWLTQQGGQDDGNDL